MTRRLIGFLSLCLPLLGIAELAPVLGATARKAPVATTWVSSWGAAQQIPEPRNALPPDSLHGATLRQFVHLSAGGTSIRLRVSNAFGDAPLHLQVVHVARAAADGGGRIDPSSDRTVLFDGRPDVLVPAGSDYISDPVTFRAAGLSQLAVTMQFEASPKTQTGHPGSRATSYLAQNGAPPQAAVLPGAKPIEHWFFLSGVDVLLPAKGAGAVVALGDSITDGHGATTDGNDRWTDVLAARLQHSYATRRLAVINVGIGGNRLLLDGLGPNTLARFDRDVLARNGVHDLIVLEGINDLGTLTRDGPATAAQHEELVQRLIGAYRQIKIRAHSQGIRVIGATLLPFVGSDFYRPDSVSEGDRQAINAWIRKPGHFDAVIDFDRITCDPAHPDRMRPDYDSGDHLHPSPAGYRAMAKAIPLALFAKRSRSAKRSS